MISITPTQEKILRGLAKYKFLSTDQIRKIFNIGHRQQVYKNVGELRDKKLVSDVIYGAVGRVGTTTKLYFLTIKGVNILTDLHDIGEIKYPKSTSTLFKNDFFHRIHTIDSIISYDKWIEQSTNIRLFFEVYFDSIGSQKSPILKNTSKTHIKLNENTGITPDCIFAYEDVQDNKRLFVLEISNGRDTGRTTQQIKNNLIAMYKGIISKKYNIEEMPTLLVIFENESHKNGVQKAIQKAGFLETFEDCDKYLFFALHSQIIDDWNSWENIYNQKIRLFS